LHGWDALSLALSEEYKSRASENRVLRRIFRIKWDYIRKNWGKLHPEEFHNLYYSRNIIWMNK
jgi:hypothetical protein